MEYAGDTAPEVWRRGLAIVLDGLRAGADVRPMTTPALTDDELESTMACSLHTHGRR
jgi:hypothetical protein